jgi:hypothetical protein
MFPVVTLTGSLTVPGGPGADGSGPVLLEEAAGVGVDSFWVHLSRGSTSFLGTWKFATESELLKSVTGTGFPCQPKGKI